MAQWLRSMERTTWPGRDVGPLELTLAEPTCIGPSPATSPVWPAGTRITVHPPQEQDQKEPPEPQKVLERRLKNLDVRVERVERVLIKIMKERPSQPLDRETMKAQLAEFAKILRGMSPKELWESWTDELKEILDTIRGESQGRKQTEEERAAWMMAQQFQRLTMRERVALRMVLQVLEHRDPESEKLGGTE